MRRHKCMAIVAVSAAVAIGSANPVSAVLPTSVGSIPNMSPQVLLAVDALSASDVWAVGSADGRALVRHWDGSAWSELTLPAHGTLRGVTAVSAHDVWAVGATASKQPLIEHFDGAAWSRVQGSSSNGTLADVSADAADDVWAVGSLGEGSLVEHWDGAAWRTVASDIPHWEEQHLASVVTLGPDDVWASGDGYTDEEGNTLSLSQHYDGDSWSLVRSLHDGDRSFAAVDASSSSDVWTVGVRRVSYLAYAPLIEHSTGKAWRVVKGPRPGVESGSVLHGVAARTSNDVWAVGYAYNGGWNKVLVEHFGGSQWRRVRAPGPGLRHGATLDAVSATSGTDAWAVGSYRDRDDVSHPLVEHWDGTDWSIVLR